MPFLFCLGLSACLGFSVLRLFASDGMSGRGFLRLAAVVSLPLGLGLSSVVYFLTCHLIGLPLMVSAALELASSAVMLYRARRTAFSEEPGVAHGSSPALLPIVAAAGVSSLISFVAWVHQMPHGAWDAFCIWNLRARFLFRNPEHLESAFSPQLGYSHIDYPLLVSETVTRAWAWMGQDSAFAPMVIGIIFTLAVVGTLVVGLMEIGGREAGMLGALFLLGTPIFVKWGASQMADVPLSFYYASAAMLLWRYYATGCVHRKLLMMSGCLAAMAGWTKNEGLCFFASLVGAVVLICPAKVQWKRRLHAAGLLFAGAAPVLVTIVLFKVVLAGANNILADQGEATVARISDWSRWALILKRMLHGIVSFGGWPVNPALLVLSGLPLISSKVHRRGPCLAVAGLLLLTLAAYFGIYLVTPNLEWHLDTSLDRLLLQLWPAWIFVVVGLSTALRRTIEPRAAATKLAETAKS
jgi:hypothetical protein